MAGRRSPLPWAGIAILLSSLACAGLQPFDPSAASLDLGSNDGILIVHIRTTTPLEAVKVSRVADPVAEELDEGEHLAFFVAPAGRYRWRHVVLKISGYEYRYILVDEGWDFSVEAGAINYPGILVVEEGDDWRSLFIRTLNRSAMMYSELERRHPQLLKRLPMRYAGSHRDDFLGHYQRALASRATGAAR
jgi:hypothetical protein